MKNLSSITELFRDEEIVEIFIKGATKSLNSPHTTKEERLEISKAIDMAYALAPICYMNQLIEMKRMAT